ncbi:MAG: ABC transporter [Phototrophicales bacterium]|nr:MAG: ABC transporter [Phototrophicales bacterium]
MWYSDRRFWGIVAFTLFLNIAFIPFSSWVLNAEYQYTLRIVTVGGALLGIVSGILGSFAVLRQQSLIGDTVAHAALPGVAIAFLIAGRALEWLLVGAAIAGWVGVWMLNAILRTTRIKQDAAMGVVLVSWFGFGVALLSYIQRRPDAGQAGIDKFIFGQAAAIVRQDVNLIAIVGAFIVLILLLFWKELKLITFDYEFAAVNGFRVRILDTLLATLIVIAIVLGLQLAGVILMVGLLIAPSVAARQWTNHLEQMTILSALFGAFAGTVGAVISALDVGLPTGPLIIVVAFGVVLLSITFAPSRGVIWASWQQRRDRRRFAAQNILQDVYRYGQSHHDFQKPVETAFLIGLRGRTAQAGLHQLEKQGFVKRLDDASWVLTHEGLQKAQNFEESQQLWETYHLYREALDLPDVQQEHHANIHDVLAPEFIQRLERLQKGDTNDQSA